MLYQDRFIMMAVGAVFIILGLATVMWGYREEKSYYDATATRSGDVREFLERWPPRLQPIALKIGGWIAVTVGVVLLITGGAVSIWG